MLRKKTLLDQPCLLKILFTYFRNPCKETVERNKTVEVSVIEYGKVHDAVFPVYFRYFLKCLFNKIMTVEQCGNALRIINDILCSKTLPCSIRYSGGGFSVYDTDDMVIFFNRNGFKIFLGFEHFNKIFNRIVAVYRFDIFCY